VNLLQPRAAEHHTDVELMVAPTVPAWLKGDPTRFRQIALNLVSNAVKFSARGLVSCRLDVYGSELVLEIIDNGIGMSSEVVSKLFTPFSQADASTTSTRQAPPSQAVPPTQRPGPCRVLVVEDNPVNQLVVKRLLESLGHQVTLAADGRKGLEATEGQTFDLVLMDCHMPVMDGFQATERIRGLDGDAAMTPIVALTASAMPDELEACKRAGMNDCLTKPVSLQALKSLLHRIEHYRGIFEGAA